MRVRIDTDTFVVPEKDGPVKSADPRIAEVRRDDRAFHDTMNYSIFNLAQWPSIECGESGPDDELNTKYSCINHDKI